jgi:hypothetical protein
MKSFKQFTINEADMTDMDLEVYPTKVKLDKDGNVSSYQLSISSDDGSSKKAIKDTKLAKAIQSFLGDADIKAGIAVSPKAMIFNVEVYADNKGIYVELGSKKVYFK